MPDSDFLGLRDDELLAECYVETFRASGPGGQKRNKTESAVRLRHRPTGLAAQAFESRSQHENRAKALARLRATIALEVRRPLQLDGYAVPPALARLLPGAPGGQLRSANPAFWPGARALLDLLAACDWAVAPAAARLGLSTGQLSRLLSAEPALLEVVNRERATRGLRRLA
jgi:hypothetical protein